MPITSSPFLTPPSTSQHNTLALLSLKRDQTIPVVLAAPTPADSSDAITNTRFGSYPHSTLLDLPWGVQVVASNVGARERKRGKKRKRGPDDHNTNYRQSQPQQLQQDEDEDEVVEGDLEPAFEAATSGFAHLLPPTPEHWTVSLPHRTQVVYTPDYSYILQRLRARPGDRVIEAGAGSGSFTHAAVRAVFNGYPPKETDASDYGKVFSFEYHEPRCRSLVQEIRDHGLEDLVRVTHRDVYDSGFLVENEPGGQNVTGVFLDLPAPWTAIPKLTRKAGPLHPHLAITICSFSPCIEQAQKAASKLRETGWINVGMSEIRHRRLDVRRDRVGLHEVGLRGVNAVPARVDEALERLRELDNRQNDYHTNQQIRTLKKPRNSNGTMDVEMLDAIDDELETIPKVGPNSKTARRQTNQDAAKDRKLFKEGRLVHRTEPELKTHTSYLVFAMLPPEWTQEDEAACEAEFGQGAHDVQ